MIALGGAERATLQHGELAFQTVTTALLDGMPLQPQQTHGIEEQALVSIAAGAIGLLEQRIVGIVEEFAQADPQEGQRTVPHGSQGSRQRTAALELGP